MAVAILPPRVSLIRDFAVSPMSAAFAFATSPMPLARFAPVSAAMRVAVPSDDMTPLALPLDEAVCCPPCPALRCPPWPPLLLLWLPPPWPPPWPPALAFDPLDEADAMPALDADAIPAAWPSGVLVLPPPPHGDGGSVAKIGGSQR